MNRLEAMRGAIRKLEAAGAKPTGRAVADEIGIYNGPLVGLNGRDAKLWARAMETEGYVREPHGLSVRWVKSDA